MNMKGREKKERKKKEFGLKTRFRQREKKEKKKRKSVKKLPKGAETSSSARNSPTSNDKRIVDKGVGRKENKVRRRRLFLFFLCGGL